jgi:type VI secretion system protein ImpA
MRRAIDIDAILAPVPGENPAGEDLRYAPTYEQIKEARRADDLLDRGDWQRETKRADWDKVVTTTLDALTKKTKDLQIAAWLTEALTITEGFEGLAVGLIVINGFLTNFWDHVYPAIEDGDLDFRAAPIEFMNEKLGVCTKDVPLTEAGVTAGYSWLKWQESREVGSEADARDDARRSARQEMIADGKLTAEEFDIAVDKSSRAFYESIFADLSACVEEFKQFDAIVDEKFGKNAPRLAEFRESLEVCERLITKIVKEKSEKEPSTEPGSEPQPAGGYFSRLFRRQREPAAEPDARQAVETVAPELVEAAREEFPASAVPGQVAVPPLPVFSFSDSGSLEAARWEEALQTFQTSGVKKALEQLFAAACSAPSIRDRNRYRLLMAKLCLKAGRADLAGPIIEELHALIEELHLERWESPMWIAEVLDTLYQCLTKGEAADSDMTRARDLFQKLCTTDVTKAMIYRL